MATAVLTCNQIICAETIVNSHPHKSLNIRQIELNRQLSYNSVTSIVQDNEGFMWFGTMKGLNRYDGKEMRTWYEDENGLSSNNITCLLAIKDGLMIGTEKGVNFYNTKKQSFHTWPTEKTGEIYHMQETRDGKAIIGARKGLFFFDLETGVICQADSLEAFRIAIDKLDQIWTINNRTVRTYNSEGKYRFNLDKKSNNLKFTPTAIYADSKGRVWIGTKYNGLLVHDRRNNEFIPFEIGESIENLKYIRCITEDDQGNLWLGTENGIYTYNFEEDNTTHYQKDSSHTVGLNDNAIYDIFQSKEGLMWIGTFFGGVNITNIRPEVFQEITDEKGESFLNRAAVSHIFHDSRKRMWYATENEGLYIQNAENGKYKRINKDTHPGLKGNNLHAIAEDPWGNIWIGSFVDGLYKFGPDLENEPISYKNKRKDPDSLPDNSIYSLLADNNETLYIGTNTGVATYDYKTGTFDKFHTEILGGKRIDSFLRDQENNIWMASHYDGIFKYDIRTGKVENYQIGVKGCEAFTSNLIFCSFRDSKNNLWFGTNNGGILKYDTKNKSWHSFGAKNSLRHRDVYFIEEDSFGKLWMSTDQGIYSFKPETMEFRNFTIGHSDIVNQFNYNSGYKDYIQGLIYFGSTNGACCFQPEAIQKNQEAQLPDILFTDLQVHNSTVMPGTDGILENCINHTKEIKLAINQNSITINLGYTDYNNSEHKSFTCEYKLEGVNKEWMEATNPQSCTYSNLRPGHYTFKVRVKSDDNEDVKERELGITVKPHLLLSPVFIIIYMILILILIMVVLNIYRNRLNDKLALQIEQIENRNLETINRHRINFFTYISHEFKSPLSILMAIFNDIEKDGNQRSITPEETRIITHNTGRLIFLVNQLMEFRSIETNHEPLKYVKGDIIEYCRRIFEQFTPLFKQNELSAEFISSCPTYETTFDNDKLEKIISNLLSNAIKHSIKRENRITISFNVIIEEDKKQMIFSVHNTGSYISEEQKTSILQPFFKTESTKEYSYNNGIGLALVNELVDMQKGKIQIESDIDKGTSFNIYIPFADGSIEYKPLDMEEVKTKNTKDIISNTIYDMNMINSQRNENDMQSEEENNGQFTILIVDDNPEMSHLLKNKLKDTYKVKRASNGIDALEILKSRNIDVIVSDIIMPKMNGYELCMRIKSDDDIKHIPIILMTSENSKESELKSLQVGADDYINKPFSMDELQLRIKNILNSKKSIKEYYHSISKMDIETNTSNKDETFIKQLNSLILDNLQESDLSVDFLAQNMNISRTQLYIRLKSITDMSATAYVNKMKIDIAKGKLKQGDLTIAEIAWELGFNSPNYFSKTFKKYTGITPAEYKKQSTEEQE